MKGSRYRCNYYRICSLIVMSLVVVFMYWAVFSGSGVSAKDSLQVKSGTRNLQGNGKFEIEKFNQGGFGRQQPRYEPSDAAKILKDELNKEDLYKDFDTDKHYGADRANPVPNNIQSSSETKFNQNGRLDSVNIPGQNGEVVSENRPGQNGPIGSESRPRQNIPLGTETRLDEIVPYNSKNRPVDPSNNQNGANSQIRENKPLNQWAVPKQNGDIPASNPKADKWIVLTTIQYPTEDVKFLAKLEGWNIVVVGDTKTPSDWSYETIHYLSVDKQKELGYQTVNLLNVKSYSRKNAGYLYAMQQGARVIYETDDDNRPLDLLKNFVYENSTTGLKFVGHNYFNPYRHFGQPTLWPRGYPLGFIGTDYNDTYQVGTYKTPSVQQGVVNGDPDMGAMFRLSRKTTTELLNVSFDGEAPPAFLPPGVLAPYNSQNTFFLYDALWSLIIPQTVTFRVCDIWRGYWAQRLLWEIGATLGFFGPNAFQKRNSHSYVEDAKQEKYLYFKTHDLYDFLLQWKCDQSLSFFQCANRLTVDMKEGGFWDEGDVQLIKAWFEDLKMIGYQEPKRVPFTMLKPSSPYPKSVDESVLSFTAREMFPPMYYNSKYIVNSYWSRVDTVLKTCNPLPIQLSLSSSQQPIHSDIVLVVVFKTSNYEIIPRLNALYASKFPHIAYCGSDFSRFEESSKRFTEPFTFVEADIGSGYFSYRCLSKVMKMKYRLKGYMMIGSDTLINPWVFDTMTQRDQIWFDHSQLLTAISRQALQMSGWKGWESEFGKIALNKAWMAIGEQSKQNKLLQSSFERDFQRNLYQNSKLQDGVYVGPSDIVYIPTKFTDMFIVYSDIFSQFNVLHEIVVPTIISGFDVTTNMVPLNGKYLWNDEDIINFASKFDATLAFLHPVNIARAMRTQEGMSFFCSKFLPKVIGGNKSRFLGNRFRRRLLR